MSDQGKPVDLPAPTGKPVEGPAVPRGRPDLAGRVKALPNADKRAMHAALDDDDRTVVVTRMEGALLAGQRPLDVVMSALGVDAATADPICRDAL